MSNIFEMFDIGGICHIGGDKIETNSDKVSNSGNRLIYWSNNQEKCFPEFRAYSNDLHTPSPFLLDGERQRRFSRNEFLQIYIREKHIS
jgi:hypothetical protein